MPQATATPETSQEVCCAILPEDAPREFETTTPPTTRVLVLFNSDTNWRPTRWDWIPRRSSMRMPKLEAATLAVMLNRRAMRELVAKEAETGRRLHTIEWSVVVRGGGHKKGFYVAQVTADLRLGWRPQSPYDIPDGCMGPADIAAKRADAHRSVREFNTAQIEAHSSPFYWAMPVTVITEMDLVDRTRWEIEESSRKEVAA